MLSLEESLANKLIKQGIDETSAKKVACVLHCYREINYSNHSPTPKRIPEIWRIMKVLEIEPYVENIESLAGLTNKESKIYYALYSITIGVAVGVKQGLLNLCEHTKYSLSAKGMDFIKEVD